MKSNSEIRLLARQYQIPMWKIALELNVHESTIIRWLRTELPQDKKTAVHTAIEKIIAKENLTNV